MREVIKTGRTVEDATELALAELGVSAEEAGIEVLELPQRRLFKSIPAKVRAYVEDEEVPEAPAPKEEKPLPKAAPKAAESPDAPKAEAPAAQPEQAQPAAGPVEEPIDLEQNPKAREAVEYLKEICAKMGAQGLTIARQTGEATILKVRARAPVRCQATGRSDGSAELPDKPCGKPRGRRLHEDRSGHQPLPLQARGKPDSAGKAHRREGGPHGPRPHAGAP